MTEIPFFLNNITPYIAIFYALNGEQVFLSQAGQFVMPKTTFVCWQELFF